MLEHNIHKEKINASFQRWSIVIFRSLPLIGDKYVLLIGAIEVRQIDLLPDKLINTPYRLLKCCPKAQYTPPTPTQLNCRVELRRRCVLGISRTNAAFCNYQAQPATSTIGLFNPLTPTVAIL